MTEQKVRPLIRKNNAENKGYFLETIQTKSESKNLQVQKHQAAFLAGGFCKTSIFFTSPKVFK